MGCFVACFGLTNKRKLRKTLYNVLHGHQKYGNYKLLPITEKSILPVSDIRDKDGCKEKNGVKSKKNGVKSKKKKKVSFNLNVQIFEPSTYAYEPLDNEEETNENTKEPEGEGSAALTMRNPSNYRYYNCTNDYDEEDGIAYEESDIEDYDDDDDDDEFDDGYEWYDDGDSDDGSLGNDEVELNDQNTSQKRLACYFSVAEERMKNQNLLDLNDSDLKSNTSGRDRSINMHSVLIPVENLTQWKAIKAEVASSKHKRKENVQPLEQNTSMHLVSEESLSFSPCSLDSKVIHSKPIVQEIAVDASLSKWLVSPNYDFSQATIHCH